MFCNVVANLCSLLWHLVIVFTCTCSSSFQFLLQNTLSFLLSICSFFFCQPRHIRFFRLLDILKTSKHSLRTSDSLYATSPHVRNHTQHNRLLAYFLLTILWQIANSPILIPRQYFRLYVSPFVLARLEYGQTFGFILFSFHFTTILIKTEWKIAFCPTRVCQRRK